MTGGLFLEQLANGIQQGLMLFLMAAGATLVFGVMRLVNLAHGSMFMLAGFVAISALEWTGSYPAALAISLLAVTALGALLEVAVFRPLYARGHLEQILASFGLVLFFNELAVILWGREPLYLSVPPILSGQVEIFPGAPYPVYRLAISGFAVAAGLALYLVLTQTRLGMRIRGGAERRDIVEAMGVNIRGLSTIVFAMGTFLAAFAGLLTAPIMPIQSGMGDPILILTLVVIIIGGVGSVKGALVGALLVGIIDTFGRVMLPQWLGVGAGSALASMAIYILLALILISRPQGLLGTAVR